MYACESVKVGHPFHIKISFVDLEKTCKLKKTGLQKRMKHDKQNRLAVLENKPVDSSQVLKNLIHAMKHLKEKSNKIINAIPEGYLPTASDNRLVNTYFYVHFICNSGSRPSAFARMRLKEIKNAKKRPQLTNDKGDSYRYLSTTDHKTGDSYIARVNFYEEDWQILYKYYKYMRPKAYDDKNDKYLFLNSNGKLLTSPPADLIDILKQEGIPHFTATDARHALTTLSRDHLSPEEQRFIDFLLCHSTPTSDKHYVDDTRNKFRKAVDKVKFLYDVALSDKPDVSISDSAQNNPLPQSSKFSSGYENPLPGTSGCTDEATNMSNKTESSGSTTSSDSSIDPLKAHGNIPQNRKMFIEKFWPNLSYDTPTPTFIEYNTKVKDNPEFGLNDSSDHRKKFQVAFLERVMKKRAEQIIENIGRQKLLNPEAQITEKLKERKWFNKKCLMQCMKIYEQRVNSKRQTVPDKQLITDPTVLQSIERQEWHLLTQFNHGDNRGYGIKAKQDIANGTIVCDYHGELLPYKEGHQRYKQNDSEKNTYMFYFEYMSKRYYIDANKPNCSCHEKKLLKGRLINHSQKKDNVKPIVKSLDDGTLIILFVSTRLIKEREKFCLIIRLTKIHSLLLLCG
jgi:integrase